MADIFNMLDTWNAAGTTFTGIKLNVTDTASAAGSLLMDLQVGGVSRFNVRKDGTIAMRLGADVAPNSGIGFNAAYTGGIVLYENSISRVAVAGGLNVLNCPLTFTATTSNIAPGDLQLHRDAANTLAQRNGPGQAQAFNLYNTYDNSLNYERGFMRWSSNILQIGTDKLGTGSARVLAFQTDGVTRMSVSSNASGVDIFFNATFRGTTEATRRLTWNAIGSIRAQTDGVFTWADDAGTSFGRLQFGGTTSSFPAIKRSTTSLQARLADDSAFTNIQGKLTTEANAVSETITATHTITLYDAAGTAYKVPCVAA